MGEGAIAMKTDRAAAVDLAAAGRPREIEEWSNLFVVHPLSRRLAHACVRLGIGANAVSMTGAAMAVAAGACFYALAWPLGPLAGFALLVAGHVFDGADGLVARATNSVSLTGAAIDGICDSVSLVAGYAALGLLAFEQAGFAALPVCAVALVSNIAHANTYEGRRGAYMKWVYGRQLGGTDAGTARPARGGLLGLLRGIYSRYFGVVPYDRPRVSRRMRLLTSRGGAPAEQARAIYAHAKRPQLRLYSVLGQNHKTVAIAVFMLLGAPLFFFVYVATLLNAALIVLVARQWFRNDVALAARLKAVEG
jgi:phosphatidylglycerophosphate synthase